MVSNTKMEINNCGDYYFLGDYRNYIYLLGHYIFQSIGNELVIFISLILSGAVFAFYIYYKKAVSVLVIYLFLLGSVLFCKFSRLYI